MAARRRPSPVRVGSLLAAAVPALEERLAEQRIHARWAESVGADVARRARPGRLERGVLEVRVDNSPWLAELRLRQAELVATLGTRFPGLVQGVRLTLGTAPREAPAAAGRPAAAPDAADEAAGLSPEEVGEIDALASGVGDADLAGALRRLMQKDRLARRRPAPPPKGVRS